MSAMKKVICATLVASVCTLSTPTYAWSWSNFFSKQKVENFWKSWWDRSVKKQQPVIEEPVVEQPVVEQPVVEEPVVEDPVAEAPVEDVTTPQEPVVVVPEEPEIADGSDTTPEPEVPVTEPEPVVKSTVLQLSWQIPTTRENGSPLTMAEIDGYEIYYTSDALNKEGVIVISSGDTSQHSLEITDADTYHFAIAAIDITGLKSQNSDFVSVTVSH